MSNARPLHPLFLADWLRAIFIHYEADPETLQSQVPYPLDLRGGTAWVSVVAFHFERMRLADHPRLSEPLFRPATTSRFLNVRTYVEYRGEPGIFFLCQFVSNPFSLPFGPPAFGLPYRGARLEYEHDDRENLTGRAYVGHGDREVRYSGAIAPERRNDALRDFLLERYTAFTIRDNQRGRFRIAHPPWLAESVHLTLHDDRLLATTGGWHAASRYVCAHYSTGVRDVRMGRFCFANAREDSHLLAA